MAQPQSVTIILDDRLREALYKSTRRDLRRPRDQARFLLRQLLLETAGNSTDRGQAVPAQEGHNGAPAHQ